MKYNSIEYRLWGRYALFTDPVSKIGGEKNSYQIPTYEAIKGITQSIYWKPTLIWIIDEVRILNKIQTESKHVKPIKYNQSGNDLAVYTYLKDIAYQVRAHFEWNLHRADLAEDRIEEKHSEMTRRALEKGGRRDIFLGVRECQGYVEPCVFDEGEGFYDHDSPFDYGLMFHGFDYPSEHGGNSLIARFWHARRGERGIIKYPRPEECQVTRKVRIYQTEEPLVRTGDEL